MATLAPLLVSFVPFAVSTSFTPGPNNLMLASAGARFGFARTIPQQAGITVGFTVMTVLVGLGVAGVLRAIPGAFAVMKAASIIYLLVLSWQIATADGIKPGGGSARPLTFLGAAAFQWINPKAWIMALGAVTTYTTLSYSLTIQVLLLAAIFGVVGIASGSTWAAFGQMLRRFLTTDARMRAFNRSMAALLVASIVPVVLEFGR